MPKKKYLIDLTDAERAELLALTTKGTVRARKMKRAQILLRAAEGCTDAQIMAALGVSRPCVERVRQRFVAGGEALWLNHRCHSARLIIDHLCSTADRLVCL